MSYLARFAVFVATVLCVSVLLTCLLVFPQMYVEINQLHRQVVSSVEEFKVNTDAAWTELMEIQMQLKPPLTLTSQPALLDSIFRPKRQNGKLPDHCNCNLPTNCARGPPGPSGLPGIDGVPGYPGLDGKDAPPSLHRECGNVPEICQKCPMGQRGLPGPPGRMGVQGSTGAPGLDGNPLGRGPVGARGEIGDDGLRGQDGIPGPPGDKGRDAIVYENLPGAKGERGIVGPLGLPGPRGNDGADGLPGEIGPAGDPGLPGKEGIPDKLQTCTLSQNYYNFSLTKTFQILSDNGTRGSPGIFGADAFYCPCPRRTNYYISTIN